MVILFKLIAIAAFIFGAAFFVAVGVHAGKLFAAWVFGPTRNETTLNVKHSDDAPKD